MRNHEVWKKDAEEQLSASKQCIRNCANHAIEADDLFQEVAVIALQEERRDWCRPQAGWLVGVARKTAACHCRYRKVRQSDANLRRVALLHDDRAGDHENSPLVHVLTQESEQHVRAAIRDLPPKYGDVIRLRFYDDESHSKIAQNLRIPEQTERTQYRRALCQLRCHRLVKPLNTGSVATGVSRP